MIRLRRRDDPCTRPWTVEQAAAHAEAMTAFDALLARDGGFKPSRAEHRAARRAVGAATPSFDWHFFDTSRRIRTGRPVVVAGRAERLGWSARLASALRRRGPETVAAGEVVAERQCATWTDGYRPCGNLCAGGDCPVVPVDPDRTA